MKRAAADEGGKPKKTKPTRMASGKTLEQERRVLGDAVKGRLSFEKWTIAATTHATVDMAPDVFQQVVVPNATRVLGDASDANAPVVVARITGSDKCGETFGSSKIKCGSRMRTWCMHKCEVVYRPADAKADLWWTMM
eukprot:CAMPEP_0198308838 /NCGR_PEP_ID=MMETSP1450-20131203/1377_1 /TAXON_ID=753684 ORGANISM="Madagascaria erythrocladiodes, Strain CCMP3234" /NCGR_SAMPLE_ID=MMETSP1450 /ASSEMBLY_ACC=CAM_ASM_001115 /LENGTH=137 /DNA_ID=CAMNT_0044011551 /DNA_START=64 /DNA_END=477 /DNA_ORIENTATION=+